MSEKITRERIFELRKLERGAEWGPWIVEAGKGFSGDNWLIASFGNDCATNLDVYLTTDHVHASECRSMGAKAEADFLAAIRNAATQLLNAAEWALENGYDDQLMIPVKAAEMKEI
jgi:hypothetical protein